MRALVLPLALTFPQFAFAAADQATIEDLNWSTVSPDASVELKQTAKTKDVCELNCTAQAGKKQLWSTDLCFATKNHLRFISNDCEKIVLLDPLPQRIGANWRGAQVAFLYRRTEVEKTASAGSMVKDATKIRELAKHFYWLGGVLGVPGNSAKYREDGTGVDLESIDGKPKTIKFDGSEFPREPPPPKRAKSKKKR
jgi:hypothetical protein